MEARRRFGGATSRQNPEIPVCAPPRSRIVAVHLTETCDADLPNRAGASTRSHEGMQRGLNFFRTRTRISWPPTPEQHTWLSQVLRGHYGNYGLIFNHKAVHQSCDLVKGMWFKALKRRSQKSKLNWTKFDRLQLVLPLPRPTTHQSWYTTSG